jgi:folate-dependent tRNA-U54 methylase TrmFO/GidA
MNANYGLMPIANAAVRGRQRKVETGRRALEAIDNWIERHHIEPDAPMARRALGL